MTDQDGQGRTWSPPQRSEAHSLTTHDATALFEQLGVPRSQRSVERYCKRGDLDCWVDPDLQVYYITRESVERLAGHFKEIDARRPSSMWQAQAGASSDTGDRPDQGRQPHDDGRKGADEHADVERLRRELEDVQRANYDLTINSRVKDEMLKRADQELQRHVEERQFLVGKIEEAHRQLGAAEAQLRSLMAPGDSSRHAAPRGDAQ